MTAMWEAAAALLPCCCCCSSSVCAAAALFVEKDYKYPADVGPDGQRLLPYTSQGPAGLDDAVDEIVERVLAAGGEVCFYAAGDLGVHQSIAAIRRK